MANKKKDVELQGHTKVDLDKVLVEEVGQFGKFQLKIALHCIVAVIFTGWTVNEFVFSTARIKTRCLIPECDGHKTGFTPEWLSYAVPASGDGFDNCRRFGNTSWSPPVDNATCSAEAFDTNVLQPCEEYVYENTNTVVYDFNLACEEWRRALIGSVRVFGVMSTLPLTGVISDRWGRRRALALTAFCAPCLSILRYWITTYPVYVAAIYVETLLGGGSFFCSYVLLLESLGPKYRVAGGAIINTSFSLGQVTLGIIAWAVPHWRKLTLALCIPQFICIFYFWTLNESVRWYLSNGKFKESEVLLKKAARSNGKEVSQKVLDELRANGEMEMKRKEERNSKPLLIILVLRNKRILKRCLVTSVWWFTMQLVYYGLSVNAVGLTGNMHWNFVTVAAVEIPGFWIVTLVIDRVGRKPLLITALLICAASQAAFIFIPDGLYALSLGSYLLGKLAIGMVATTVNVYTLELYPTEYRHRFYSFSAMMGRFGSVLAPLTPAFGAATFEKMPFVLFGITALIAAFLTTLTPETRGVKLPDTFEEADTIGRSARDHHK